MQNSSSLFKVGFVSEFWDFAARGEYLLSTLISVTISGSLFLTMSRTYNRADQFTVVKNHFIPKRELT